MRPTLSKKDGLLLCGFSIAAALPAYFAYEAVGWIGIGVLGLVIAFISVRVELEHDAPIGGTRDAAVYGAMLREREQMDGAGRAAKETEKTSNLRTTFVAKVVGAAFVLVGFGGFFLFQLPRRH